MANILLCRHDLGEYERIVCKLYLQTVISYVHNMCGEENWNLSYMYEFMRSSIAWEGSSTLTQKFICKMEEYCTKFPDGLGANSYFTLRNCEKILFMQ